MNDWASARFSGEHLELPANADTNRPTTVWVDVMVNAAGETQVELWYHEPRSDRETRPHRMAAYPIGGPYPRSATYRPVGEP